MKEFPPILSTERLCLRPGKLKDLDDCAEIWAHPSAVRHITSQPLGKQEAWTKLLGHLGLWEVYGYGYWVIECRAMRRVIGQTGFAHYIRATNDDLDESPEMGWIIHPDQHGNGFAYEAAEAALKWFHRSRPHMDINAYISTENTDSIRLAKSLGFKKVQDEPVKNDDLVTYRYAATRL